LIRDLGPRRDLFLGPAADRVLDQRELIVWKAKNPRDVVSGRRKGLCTDDQRGLAKLLETNTVVHTAR